MQKQKLQYFFPINSSFVRKDRDIFSSDYEVINFEFLPKTNWHTVLCFYKQLLFIWKNRKDTKYLVSQFAGHHSLLPTLIGKLCSIPHIIVLGGTDCNWLPSIKYGNFNKPILRYTTYISMKFASQLWPVNKELIHCDYTYTSDDFPNQGYKAFYKITTPVYVIPNGVNPSDFYVDNSIIRQQNSFITICGGLEEERRRLTKGIDLFVEMAKSYPKCKFTIIGGEPNSLGEIPQNLTILPFMDNKALVKILNTYAFYVQLSLTEGFPNAVLEAMACGCIPIVSSVGGMPDIVGSQGFILHEKNNKKCIELFDTAIQNQENFSPNKISSYVFEKYSLILRKNAILNRLSQPV